MPQRNPLQINTIQVHERFGDGNGSPWPADTRPGATRIRTAGVVLGRVLAFDPERARALMQWMVDHFEEHIDSGGELVSTTLAEAAADHFDCYQGDDVHADLFELAHAVAVAYERGQLVVSAEG